MIYDAKKQNDVKKTKWREKRQNDVKKTCEKTVF